jgi:cation diffusion facilitator family transporter
MNKINQKKRNALDSRAGLVSIIVNILLFIFKYWAGILSGSVALLADAWHTLSDSLSSLAVIVGVKLSAKKPDKKHPFGHGRWEYLAAILIGLFLAIVAYEFILESIERFFGRVTADFGLFAIIITAISVVAKEGLAQYSFYVFRKTGNISVRADGWHHRTDALSSIVILVGILLKDFFWWIDSVMGLIVSLMLVYVVYEILKEAINKILGTKPSDELMAEIKSIIECSSCPEVHAHHYHLHDYGNHKELTFHIMLPPEMDIRSGHQMATKLEREIFDKLEIEATVHVEPIENNK